MKICPIFYAVLLHRRGNVDGGQLNMYGKCLGEECQWAERCNVLPLWRGEKMPEITPEDCEPGKVIETPKKT